MNEERLIIQNQIYHIKEHHDSLQNCYGIVQWISFFSCNTDFFEQIEGCLLYETTTSELQVLSLLDYYDQQVQYCSYHNCRD